jgi:hypothetical protein
VVALRSTRSRIVAAVVLVVVLAFVRLTLRLFVYPDLNAPEPIVVLGGNGAGPFDEVVALARQHDAPTIVFSLVPAYSCQPSVVHLPSERIRASGPTHRPRRARPVPSPTWLPRTTGTGSSS